jgi:hypothetical protein
VRRRDFIKVIAGSAASAWPLTIRAQAMPVIGYLSARSPEDTGHLRMGDHDVVADFDGKQKIPLRIRYELAESVKRDRRGEERVEARVREQGDRGGEPTAMRPSRPMRRGDLTDLA